MQKAVEAYVYCVLGAQANTRWKIVGAGAKSLQTQEAFAKLAKETVAQDDDTVLISNMRTAVKATNVVLNLAILPRMILIPSDLLILKKKIPGYNNTLTIATKSMSFGKNEKINFSEETSTETSTEETSTKASTEEPKVAKTNVAKTKVSVVSLVKSVKSTKLGFVDNVVSKSRVGKNSNELSAVFVVLTLVGAFGFRLLS